MKRKHSPRRLDVDFDALLAADAQLKIHHDLWTGYGYRFDGGRGWRRKDGTFTIRFVWRAPVKAVVKTVTYTVEGYVLV